MAAARSSTAYLSLGSNRGERLRSLQEAVTQLSQDKRTQVLKVSSVYETSAVGFRRSPYLNAALKVRTKYTPERLLNRLKRIEKALGRTANPRRARWGPRPIDIDIIFQDRRRLMRKNLSLPHPQFRYRRFVLMPLLEIEPRLKDPLSGKTLKRILGELTSTHQKVKLYAEADVLRINGPAGLLSCRFGAKNHGKNNSSYPH